MKSFSFSELLTGIVKGDCEMRIFRWFVILTWSEIVLIASFNAPMTSLCFSGTSQLTIKRRLCQCFGMRYSVIFIFIFQLTSQ